MPDLELYDSTADSGFSLTNNSGYLFFYAPLSLLTLGWQAPPVSLGCVLLQELRILDGFAVHELEPGSPAFIDLLVECKERRSPMPRVG